MVATELTLLLLLDQLGLFQNIKMMRDGWLSHVAGIRDVPCRERLCPQHLQDLPSRWIIEGLEQRIHDFDILTPIEIQQGKNGARTRFYTANFTHLIFRRCFPRFDG